MENTKVFSGGKPVVMQITNSINRLKEVSNIIEDSDKNPEIYLKQQLFESYLESQYILNNTFAFYGEQAINSFHIDYIQKVLKVLKSNLPSDDIFFETFRDEEGYYVIHVSVYFLEESVPILNIYPYFKKYEILSHERLLELEKYEKNKLEEVKEYKEKINFIQQCYTNPSLYANGNVKLFIKMSNKKQKELILNEELNQTNIAFQIANNELLNIQEEIMLIRNTLSSVYISRDRYIERLRNRYKYTPIIFEETEMLEESEPNNLFSESMIMNNENKDFFENMMEDNIEKDEINIEYFS